MSQCILEEHAEDNYYARFDTNSIAVIAAKTIIHLEPTSQVSKKQTFENMQFTAEKSAS